MRNAIETGTEIHIPEPGALIAWHRGLGPLDWHGHTGIIYSYSEDYDYAVVIEANKNQAGDRFAYVHKFPYPSGAWRHRLYKMARVRA